MNRRALFLLAAALVLAATVTAGPAQADEKRLVVELNKFEPLEGACRTFFLFRNATAHDFESFEMSLAVLDRDGVIDQLLTVQAAPLPAERTTLKLFEIPDLQCDRIGEVIVHEIPQCAVAGGAAVDCYEVLSLVSLTDASLVK